MAVGASWLGAVIQQERALVAVLASAATIGVFASPVLRLSPPATLLSGEKSAGAEPELLSWITARGGAAWVVLCTSLTRAPLEHLANERGMDVVFLSYPSSTAEHLGGQDDGLLLHDPVALQGEAQRAVWAAGEALRTCPGAGAEFHVVLTPGPVNRVLQGQLDQAVAAGLLAHGEPSPWFQQRGTHQPMRVHMYRPGPEGGGPR